MSSHAFKLKRIFGPPYAECNIDGSLIINPLLGIIYQISGEIDQLIWPKQTNKPQRLDGLWEKTCLELFIAECGENAYYEFNFSPNGDWQCYQFSSYRNFSAKPELQNPPSINKYESTNEYIFNICVDIRPLSLQAPLDIGINAVLQQPTAELNFYSLNHQTEIPNFHRRENFVMKIA